MDELQFLHWRAMLKRDKKMLPLAKALIAAASEQGASLRELKSAFNFATEVYTGVIEQSGKPISVFQDDAKAAFDRIEEKL